MKTGLLIGIIVAIVIVIGVIAFIFMSYPMQTNTPTPSTGNQDTTQSNTQTPTDTGTTSQTTTNPSTVPAPKTYNIAISNFAFSPSTLSINKGDTVVWINKDSASHTVTSDSGNEIASGSLSNGQTFSHTFNTAGSFDYHCAIHPSMKANIIVN
jgi:plastocyanin